MTKQDLGTLRWFGKAWPTLANPAPICDPRTHVSIPLGRACFACHRTFLSYDRGVGVPLLDDVPAYLWYHLHCWLRVVLPKNGHKKRSV